MIGRLFLSAAAVTIAVPALSQTTPPAATEQTRELAQDRGHDVHTDRHDAVDAVERPVTQSLNIDARAQAAMQNAVIGRTEAQREAYAVQEMRYEGALKAHAADEVAYAHAMRRWRTQVADCNAGITAACNAPAPDPADFR